MERIRIDAREKCLVAQNLESDKACDGDPKPHAAQTPIQLISKHPAEKPFGFCYSIHDNSSPEIASKASAIPLSLR